MGMKARANVATFFKYFVLIFMGFIMVYPLLWMVGSTFKTNAEIFTSLSPFTAHPTLDGYYNAVTKTYGGDITIWRAFLNTYSYVIPKVVFTVISSVIAAYGFSRFKFKGRDFLFGVMIMTLFLPQVVLNVPQYMMYNKFNWINTPLYPALCVPSFIFTSREICESAALTLTGSSISTPLRSQKRPMQRYIAPVSTYIKPKRFAHSLAMELLPAPTGPSIATAILISFLLQFTYTLIITRFLSDCNRENVKIKRNKRLFKPVEQRKFPEKRKCFSGKYVSLFLKAVFSALF